MKNKIKIGFIVTFLLVIVVSIATFYYKISIGFGNAAVQTIETIEEIKTDFKERNINLLDTVMKQSDKVLDSIPSSGRKDSLESK